MHGVDLDEFTTLISLKYLLQICFHCSPKFKSILYKNHCYGNGGYHFECQNLFSTIISLVLSFYYETNVISCIRRDFIQIQGIYLKGSVSSMVCLCCRHENGNKQRSTKRRHVQGMLDETDPLNAFISCYICEVQKQTKLQKLSILVYNFLNR